MHSSRMRTDRSSSRHGGSPHHPQSRHPPGAGTPLPLLEQAPPGQIPSTSPLGVDLDQIPLNFPLGVGLETLPGQIPLNFPLGCGPGNLQGMLGYHPHFWRPAARHAGIPPAMDVGIAPPPPPCGQTHTCKNITFANYVCGR